MLTVLAALTLVLALIPLGLYLRNHRAFERLPGPGNASVPQVSVLIPARDEEETISDAVRSVLSSEGVDLEVVVADDHSRDGTAAVVDLLAAWDPRVTLIDAPQLPEGWCGKQHACWILSRRARHRLLVFMDADVRLAPDALARLARFVEERDVALASGFPRQETVSFLEQTVLPLMHFLLLGFLPLRWMRRSRHAAFGAGCGQLMAVTREGYDRAGGHRSIRSSLHDGLTLPVAFRRAGLATDVFDATDVARCRMYRTSREVWDGLAKNAIEGLGHPSRIAVFTVLLLGQVAPALLLGLVALGLFPGACAPSLGMLGGALASGYVVRFDCARRFAQPWLGALLHPFGVAVLLAIQWFALARHVLRRPAAWKGRDYGSPAAGDGEEET